MGHKRKSIALHLARMAATRPTLRAWIWTTSGMPLRHCRQYIAKPINLDSSQDWARFVQSHTLESVVPRTADQIGANCLGDEDSGFVGGKKLCCFILKRPTNLAITAV